MTVSASGTAVPGALDAALTASASLTLTDDDTRGVTVSKSTLGIVEGTSGTYTVKLDSQPTANVTITPSSDNTDVTFTPASLTFTASSYSEKTVTVSGAADTDTTDDTATISHAVAGGDYGANSVTAASVTVTVTEPQPKATLVLSRNPVDESGANNSATITATLDKAATAETTITVSATPVSPAVAGDFTLSSNKTLTFAANATNSTGTVTITAVDNKVDAANKTVTVSGIIATGSATALDNVTLTITDDDTRGVTVSKSTLRIVEGTSGTYTVKLNSEPTASVTITPSSNNTDVTFTPASLTFTASSYSEKTVTVSGAADTDTTDDTATISHAVAGGDYGANSVTAASVTVTVTEPNAAPAFSSTSTPSVAENQTTVVTVMATDADSADSITGYTITGGADSGKFNIGATSGVLTFKTAPNFENPTDVASTSPSNDAENNEYVVVVTATGGAGTRAMTTPQTIVVTVTDENEAPRIPPVWSATLTVDEVSTYFGCDNEDSSQENCSIGTPLMVVNSCWHSCQARGSRQPSVR